MNEARFTISLDENSIYRIVRWEGLKPILEIDPNKLDNHMRNFFKAVIRFNKASANLQQKITVLEEAQNNKK